MRDLLARQLREASGGGPIVIDLSRITLRPSDVRAVHDLLGRLAGCQVWLACSRLSGRRVLNRLLERPCAVVRHLDDVPVDLGGAAADLRDEAAVDPAPSTEDSLPA